MLLGLTGLLLLIILHLLFVSQASLQISCLQLAGNEILVHSLKHVLIGALGHSLSIDLVLSLFHGLFKLSNSFFVVGDWSLNLCLLDLESSNLLADTIVFLLLESDKLFGVVVFLLDL